MNAAVIEGAIPIAISIGVAVGTAFLGMWMQRNRTEIDDLDRAERRREAAEHKLAEAERERDRLQQQVYDLMERLYRSGEKRP